MTGTAIQLGTILTAQHGIHADVVNRALDAQTQQGGRLGEILMHHGLLHPISLYQALAAHHALSFVNLIEEPCDPALLHAEERYQYLAYQALPWRREGATTVIATCDITPALQHWAARMYGEDHRFVITSPRDIAWTVEEHFGLHLDDDSRNRLLRLSPHQSAHIAVEARQRRGFAFGMATFLLLSLAFPTPSLLTLIVAMNIFYLLTVGLKLVLYRVGARTPIDETITATAAALDEKTLPVYTILVPLYKESESLPRLLEALRAVEYPRAKLDIKLVIEADDYPTLRAAKDAKPEGMFDIIRVPFSLPRTKPKACNYALNFARGEYVTIYDAEDAPPPLQLKEAVAAFRAAPPDVACLQARLNYYNYGENLLTRLFAIEYSTWFDFMLPGLQALRIPIPLGGTSNHIALSRLRGVGDWDPYNVTEDADLGVRLAALGLRTEMLPSCTMEEAPARLGVWMKQRARWIKGYMQTWLVHMRSPLALYKSLGARGFWGFQFFVGGPPLVFLTAPVLWSISALWAAGAVAFQTLPAWLSVLCAVNLAGGVAIHFVMSLGALKRWQWRGMALALFAFPFYWLLHSFASYRALWQLIHAPHKWDKTPHGTGKIAQKS